MLQRLRRALQFLLLTIYGALRWRIVVLPQIVQQTATRYITVATVIRNEGPYLQEWLDFHIALGVDRFILYDNGSTDQTLRVCEPYIREGVVTIVPWVNFSIWSNHQRAAYAHALANFGPGTTWMGFFDVDEFMMPVTACSLREILRAREALPALLVAGIHFGTSGHAVRPKGGVVDSYRMAVPMHLQRRYPAQLISTKGFVRPPRVAAIVSLHWFKLRGTRASGYTEHGWPIYGRCQSAADRLTVDVIRYNHYFTRSLEEFERKASGPDARGPLWKGARAGKRRMFELIEAHAREERFANQCAPEPGAARRDRTPGIEGPSAA
jgi:hypothetical protein